MSENQSPVSSSFFESAQAQALVQFEQRPDGQKYYIPRDGQGAMGPIIPFQGFMDDPQGEMKDTAFLCDPGTDDFMTGMLAFDHRSTLKPFLVIPSFGNVSAAATLKNALLMVSLCEAFKVVVAPGAVRPMAGPMPEDAAGEHGADGLNGAKPANLSQVQDNISRVKQEIDGVKLLKKELMRRAKNNLNPITIVNTGSLTDLAVTLQALDKRDPKAISKIGRISMMGGGIDTKKWHTNITDWAEFNIFQDPKAAKIAFDLIKKYKIPTAVFPLDLTHQTGVRENYEGAWLKSIAARKGNAVAGMVAQIYKAGGFDIERSKQIFKFAVAHTTRFMHDPNTVSALDNPSLYGGLRADINVVLDGDEKGRTIITPNPQGSVFVAVQADAKGVVQDWQSKISTFQVSPDLR